MGACVELHTGSLRWRVASSLADGAGGEGRLLGPAGLRLDEWLADGRARLLKEAPHRVIYRVSLGDLDFHVKHYPVGDTRSWLRQLVRPSKARSEYDKAVEIARRGVPTIEPLALGEPARGVGASYLLTRTLTDARPLNGFLETAFQEMPPRRQAILRQRLAVALARLLARMHAAGIAHHDLHPGNLLLRLDQDERPLLYLIDLHAARLGEPLAWKESRRNLILLNRWFALRSQRSDRLRFWRAYQQARREAVPSLPTGALEKDLERGTLLSNLGFWRQSDQRCLGTNRYYRRVKRGGVVGHAVADLDPGLVERLLADPEMPFRQPDAHLLKASTSSVVVELPQERGADSAGLVYKRFSVKSRTAPWLALLRPAAALRSFTLGHGLRLRGLPTPRPLLVLHRRRHGLPRESYLLVEKVPRARNLHEYLADLGQLPAPERRSRLHALLAQLGRVVAGLHHRRLSHRDLKAGNLLVSPRPWVMPRTDRMDTTPLPVPQENGPQVWLIDLVGVSESVKLRRGRKVQNLARLNASFLGHPGITHADRLRVLLAYLGWRGRPCWKEWWRQIARATQKKVKQNQRRGRPLL